MNRLERILTGALALLVITLAVLGLLWWRQSQLMNEPLIITNSNSDIRRYYSAQTAYEQAQLVAEEWAADAQLVEANATWPISDQFAPLEANWSFTFYSPQSNQLALITVTGSRARVFSSRSADERYQLVHPAAWQVDSPEIVSAVMENSGQEFINQHGPSSLTLKLTLNQLPAWETNLVAGETNHHLFLWFHAGTGELLDGANN
jgi:hypothetical protein